MAVVPIHAPPRSVKGICLREEAVILLRNERQEWELPGGRVEPSESPADALRREIAEELGVTAEVGPRVNTWLYEPLRDHGVVMIVTHVCAVRDWSPLTLSDEHSEVGTFGIDELGGIPLPEGYRLSIEAASARGLLDR